MRPLIVRYERTAPTNPDSATVVLTQVDDEVLVDLRKKINKGEVDEVILVGRHMCTGWRIATPYRDVDFRMREFVDEQDGIAQWQAKYRIIGRDRSKS